ncbi:putative short chain dehydrogenase/reductase [Colletotrichum sublineola]|uniref:Putative short chain dehydrogenase/reductase n=1 Tax=Colletotrichum sublineola TaxID=1173701 RepID=A0A066WXW0_COLSU|nr:putative short chain dehydrogenase/reductase [Colletotrichum sublineola]
MAFRLQSRLRFTRRRLGAVYESRSPKEPGIAGPGGNSPFGLLSPAYPENAARFCIPCYETQLYNFTNEMAPSLKAASLFAVKDWVIVVYAQALAANGAKVYITGRRREVLEQSARVHGSAPEVGASGGQIIPLVMDVTSKDSIKGAVDRITESDGYVNVSMFDQSIDLWQRAFLVNATSVYFVTAAFLPLLAKSVSSPTGKMGSVINTTSNSGQLRMSEGSQLAYNVSKAASVQVTRQLAFDFSHENIKIRVNGIAPGWWPSEMTTGASDNNNESTPQEDSAFQKEMLNIGARVPPGRMGKAEELASGLLMLATNDYIWGMNLVIDGGILQSVAGNI